MSNEQIVRALLAGLRAFVGAVETMLDAPALGADGRRTKLPASSAAPTQTRRRRGGRIPVPPTPTTPISEVAEKRAEQALRRNGVVT
jgi:hypothetical protein